jgi:rhodanese-related sulfurtransferase
MPELRNVTVTEAYELVQGGAMLLDVREESEWELGRAPEAVHIPLAEVPDHLDELEKGRQIVCACRSGGRSSRAGQFLAEQGFDVVNLDGGMLAWAQEGLPLVADHGEPAID